MSQVAISGALEGRLKDMPQSIATAWENDGFVPVVGTPYQAATVLYAEPENPSFGSGFYRERGALMIRLCYPLGSGRGAAEAYGDKIRDYFKRGLSLTAGDVKVVIERTPELVKGGNQDGWYVINVRIRFFANVEG